MKKVLLFIALFIVTNTLVNAQQVAKTKWKIYTLGGKKGYFTKTYQFSNNKMLEISNGSGDQWEGNKVEVAIVANETEGTNETIVLKYGDSSFYAYYFENITADGATVHFSNEFVDVESAKTYKPTDANSGSKWYTVAGFAKVDKLKAMPELQKKDALAFAKYFVGVAKNLKAKLEENTTGSDDEKAGRGLAMVMMLSATPTTYAESKGFHPYKSIAVMERGMKKFEKDKDVKKIMSEFKMD